MNWSEVNEFVENCAPWNFLMQEIYVVSHSRVTGLETVKPHDCIDSYSLFSHFHIIFEIKRKPAQAEVVPSSSLVKFRLS